MEADLTRLPLKSILIRSTNWIGDAIMTTPAVHTIRSNFPDARITMLAMPWVGDIFRLSPDVDEVIDYDKKVRHKGKVKGVLAVGKELREHQFDAVIYLQNAFEAAFIGSLAKIPVRAGFRRDGRGILLSHGVKIPAELRKKHQVYYYQYLCKALGMSLGPDRLHLPLPEKLKQWTETRLATLIEKHGRSTPDGNKVPVNPAEAERVPVIGFNPGAAYGPAKRWPAAKFSELATMICERLGDSGCVILVFGTDADSKAAAEIADSSARCGHHVVDLTGKTSLEQVIGLIDRCNGFITNDSGLMHVAAALDTPSVTIFGSTDHIATGPFSDHAVVLRREMNCSPCMETHCPKGHLDCLEGISSQDVLDELDKLLSKQNNIILT